MGEEDYAVKAAKEWLEGKQESDMCQKASCNICNSIRASNTAEIVKLAAVIRKHVEERPVRKLGDSSGDSGPKTLRCVSRDLGRMVRTTLSIVHTAWAI